MHDYNFLTQEEFKLQELKKKIQKTTNEWKYPLYEIYTMSTGTLLNIETCKVDELMYKNTLEITNKKIKHLISIIDTFNSIEIDNIIMNNSTTNNYIFIRRFTL